MNNIKYCGFLRGINVGGHVLIKMADLKKVFEKMGFKNVRTILASGNIIFEAKKSDSKKLANEIETELKKNFKRDIKVMLRSINYLEKLQSEEPFKNIKVTPDTRRYVTLLAEKTKAHTITIPYASANGEFRIIHNTPWEVFSVVDLSKGKGTIDAMSILEKEFGSNITTRNWNTIERVLTQKK
jgi:uncharacterized protein (DUF1697 family)